MKERLFIQKAKDQVTMEEFIRSQFEGANCGTIEVQYTPIVTRIIVYTTTPGLIVGSGGERIRSIVEKLKEKFDLKNPQIDVQRISNPFLDPYIVAQNIARSIERGTNYKKLGEFNVLKIMRAGAIGCELVFSGKITGQRSRKERFSAGYIKKSGKPAEEDVLTGFVVANPKLGNIGVTVKIMIKRSDMSTEETIKQLEKQNAQITPEQPVEKNEKQSNKNQE